MAGSWFFDGVDDWIGIAANAAQETPDTAVTLAGWFRPVGGQDGTQWTMAGKKHTAGTAPHIAYDIQHIDDAPHEYQGIIGLDDDSFPATAAASVTADVWQFWAVTWSSGNPIRFRIWTAAGTLSQDVTSANQTGTLAYAALGVQLGKNGPSNRFWEGHCAYFGATDTVLSDGQLDTWRTTGVPPVTLSAFFLPLDSASAVDTAQGGTVNVTGAVHDANESPPTSVPPTELAIEAAVETNSAVDVTPSQTFPEPLILVGLGFDP